MKYYLLGLTVLASVATAAPWQADRMYQAGDQVSDSGDVFQCNEWPASQWCHLAPYQPKHGAFWPLAWTKLDETMNHTKHPEFILGETQAENGEVYFYQENCWQAQNNPGVWETPSEGWFWQSVACVSQPTVPMMAVSLGDEHFIWRNDQSVARIDFDFNVASLLTEEIQNTKYSGLYQYAGSLAGAYQVNLDTIGVFLNTDEYLQYSTASKSVLPGFPVPMTDYFAGMQSGVVGIMRWRNHDRIYAFYDNGTYDRITLSRKQVDGGYPKPIEGYWPGLGEFANDIQAISTVLPDFADVFISDNRVVRYDLAADRVMPGYPQTLPSQLVNLPYNDAYEILAGANNSGWISAAGYAGYNTWQSNFDNAAKLSAAFELSPTTQGWLLNNGTYAEVSTETGEMLPGYPVAQSQAIAGLSDAQQVVGALKWNDNRVHLFLSDASYVRVNLAQMSVDSGYPKAISNGTWPGLADYASSIQAVLNHGYEFADILLTDNRVVRYSIEQDKVVRGPLPLGCVSDYLGLVPDASCELSFIANPYLQAPSHNSMTVMFEMQPVGAQVQYWREGEAKKTVPAQVASDDPLGLVHEAKLDNLDSNTSYQYQIVANGQVSATYRLHTYPATTTQRSEGKFIAVSDVQNGNVNVLADIVQGIIDTECEGIAENCAQALAGIIMAGDITQTGGNRSHWRDHVFARIKAISPYVPLIPVTGNHDYYSDGELVNYRSYFAPPSNNDPQFEEHWYQLDYLDFRFIGLDSYPISGLNGRFNRATLATQQDWLLQTLNDSLDKTFVVAAFHHPCLSEMWLKGESIALCEAVKTLENFSAQTGITTGHVFGHTHSYSRGQSRDVAHLWLNAASVSGSLEPLNDQAYLNREVFDYDTIAVSNNHYGYSTLAFDFAQGTMTSVRRDFDRQAGEFPLTDQVRFAQNNAPATPKANSAVEQRIDQLELSVAGSESAYELHWQLSKNADFSGEVFDLWGNSTRTENWQYQQDASLIDGERAYGHQPINKQAEQDISKLNLTQLLAERGQAVGGDEQFYWQKLYTGQATHSSQLNQYAQTHRPSLTIQPGDTWFWRARARSQDMVWSQWTPVSQLKVAGQAGNELLNDNQWQVTDGVMQKIAVPTAALFAPAANAMIWAGHGHGGSTAAGSVDRMEQTVSVNPGDQLVFKVAMTTWENRDQPYATVVAIMADGSEQELTRLTTRYARTWDLRQVVFSVPVGAQEVEVVMGGKRNAGSDNDIYFDQVSLRKVQY
ncbi:metallophosphoesterase [Salinibius halmophilus]|uniref:metallophosphoesterase n=1 Tax=Salinibius halmophilus TaxID=1853216 RepID=UPI000E663C65|nr:metallophosphoesterase [Salinibius halmophilus]